MKGFTGNIEDQTEANYFFRKVVFTAPHSQLVLMSLKPKEEIGEEVHDVDQFFRFEEGEGKVVINGEETIIKDGWAAVVPAIEIPIKTPSISSKICKFPSPQSIFSDMSFTDEFLSHNKTSELPTSFAVLTPIAK